MIGGKIQLFFSVWKDCLSSIKQVKLFTPFLLFAVVQFLLLAVLINFYRAPFNGVFVPLIKKLFENSFLHYPNYFLIIPFLFNNLNIILSGIVGIIFVALGTIMFAKQFQQKKVVAFKGLNKILSKYGILFILWMIESIIVLSLLFGIPDLSEKYLHINYINLWFLQFCTMLLGIFIASIFAYTTAAAVLDNCGIIRSLSTSARMFGGNMVSTFLFVGIPNIIIWPFGYITSKTQFLLQKFNPEIIIVLISLTIFISIFTNYILVGTLTRFYLIKKFQV